MHAPVKLAADGSALPATATDHAAVHTPATGLMWSHTLGNQRMTHAQALAACAALTLLVHSDWRLPTRAELLSLVDDTRFNPAIDTDLFADTRPNAYWSASPAAWAPADAAWFVYFSYGVSGCSSRGLTAFVRAVRSVGAGQ